LERRKEFIFYINEKLVNEDKFNQDFPIIIGCLRKYITVNTTIRGGGLQETAVCKDGVRRARSKHRRGNICFFPFSTRDFCIMYV
jgi:hypothetical protein